MWHGQKKHLKQDPKVLTIKGKKPDKLDYISIKTPQSERGYLQ